MTQPHEQLKHPSSPQLRVVFLVGKDDGSTRLAIAEVCQLSVVKPVAVLVGTHAISFLKRMKNLRRSVRKEGWRYLPIRLAEGLRAVTDKLADRAVVSQEEVRSVLRQAFPERCFDMEELGAKLGFAVRRVGHLNQAPAIEALRQCEADLGIVLGGPILKATTFEIPRLGCINLHKGRVPEYRGMPPGFWELYDGAPSAGVTVHHVATKLDAGDVIETAEITISACETPESLREKLHQEGARTLARVVAHLQTGTAQRRKQTDIALKPRTKPTLRDIAVLHRRLPHWRTQNDWLVAIKNLISLTVYYSGLYAVRKAWRRSSRAAILLHHRVNDYAGDKLSVDTETFAAQLLALSKRYPTMTSSELVDRIQQKKAIAPTTVLIHFDDAYRDVFTNGAPILKALGMPAMAFVNSGYVDTDRVFAHDLQKYPFQFENFRSCDLREWLAQGFEIGAHTVNHVDLGQVSGEEARYEISVCATQLHEQTGKPPALFSFPFGKPSNIRDEAVAEIRRAGYRAIFSAHGGFVGTKTDLWDIPRLGANSDCKPLYLLLEIEGLGASGILEAFKRAWAKLTGKSATASWEEKVTSV